MKAEAAASYLNQTTLLRLMAVLTLVLSVHLPTLPEWAVAFVFAGLGWRLLVALRQWSLPPGWLRSVMAILVFAGIYASYGRINGQHPGTALLVIMAVLKLLEMRSRRDVMVTVFLMYFILLTHFLNSQEIWTAGYLLACVSLITALLVDVNHPGQALPLREVLTRGMRMVALSLPVMLLFFVLFPRIPGPLWGLPSDSGAALSGMSNEMAPGDISSLILSDRVAFRVRFLGEVPQPKDRYWRGPVLDHFDGRGWKPSAWSQTDRLPAFTLNEPTIRYEVTMEPHRGPWLFALDIPDMRQLPPNAVLTSEFQLIRGRDVLERELYILSSHPDHLIQPDLPILYRNINLALPQSYNPQTLALAQRLKAENPDPQALVQAVLRMFREQPFVYTLRPPVLGRNSVDDFLFKTRRGFCEHYSSAFTFLMRAAGIPARVVTGYQGGERSPIGDFHTIRDADAHAWSEIWLEGQGWIRMDPTAAVAPNRIEMGLSEAMDGDELPSFLRRDGFASLSLGLRARWEWVNSKWNRWVLAYGPDMQMEFLQQFGIRDWTGMILTLTIGTTVVLSIIGLMLLRQFTPARNHEVAVKLWQQLQKRLLRAGIAQRPSEGAGDFAERVAREAPPLGAAVARAAAAYQRLRYLEGATPALQRELAEAVKAVRTKP
ncbi:transglutaminase TgpA family protein [Solimonas sp. K1W22B-7]|uniref:transglutaminase TgpA family protein n=1 Tax=Solimonas sp. K1W22B-7 TaxID=2303331 RepID=UPI0013C51689|nr:DUF3488 and transglutaminase-like domain-containing protein [Solimonas sp. K1W22B-7]